MCSCETGFLVEFAFISDFINSFIKTSFSCHCSPVFGARYSSINTEKAQILFKCLRFVCWSQVWYNTHHIRLQGRFAHLCNIFGVKLVLYGGVWWDTVYQLTCALCAPRRTRCMWWAPGNPGSHLLQYVWVWMSYVKCKPT